LSSIVDTSKYNYIPLICSGTGRPLLVRSRWKTSLLVFLISVAYAILSSINMEPTSVLLPQTTTNEDIKRTAFSTDSFFRTEDRIFSIRPDQMATTEIGNNKTGLWTREFPALLTAASVGKELSAWGLLDGHLIVLDGNGAMIPDNPDISILGLTDPVDACIYGVGISSDGASLIVLYGRKPQYLVALRREESGFIVKANLKMKEEVTTSSQITFSSDGLSALARTGDGLFFYDATRKKFSQVIPRFNAEDLRIFSQDNGFITLLSGNQGKAAIVIKSNRIIACLPVKRMITQLELNDNKLNLISEGYGTTLGVDRR